MNLLEEMLGLIDAFRAASIDYAICGGIAVAIHGYPRFTRDIDVLVRGEDLESIRRVTSARGFRLEGCLLRFGTGTPEERTVFRVSKADGPDLITLDLLLVTPALREVWEPRESVTWKGRTLDVVTRDGLMRMKRLAGRAQDWSTSNTSRRGTHLVTEVRRSKLDPELVAQRLRDLEQIYELGVALREVRFASKSGLDSGRPDQDVPDRDGRRAS